MLIYFILVFALILRLVAINQSFWLDEAIQVLESNNTFLKIWQIPADFHPPFFHYIAHFWLLLGHDEWLARLLPVILGLGSIYFTYLLIKLLYSRLIGLISALFLATSPFHIYYSQEFRPYMLSCLLATASIYLFFRYLKTDRSIDFFLILANLLGLYSTYFFPFIILGELAVCLIYYRQRLKLFIINLLLSFLFFIPWLPMFVTQLSVGSGWAKAYDVWSGSVAIPLVKALPLVLAKFWLGNISFNNKIIYGIIIFFLFLTNLIPKTS